MKPLSQNTNGLLHLAVETLRPAAQPVRPAVLRLTTGAFTIWNNLRRRSMFHKLNRQDASQFDPVGPVRVLRRPLPPRVANALYDAAQVTNIVATLGIAHRVSGPVNAALQLWTLSYRNSWGMILHNDNMALMHQLVLGVTPSADALSVDALVRDKTLTPQRFDRAYGGIPTAMNVATLKNDGETWSRSDVARLKIARALLGNPPLVVLENIDAALDEQGLVMLRKLLDEYPGTVLFSSLVPQRLFAEAEMRRWPLDG